MKSSSNIARNMKAFFKNCKLNKFFPEDKCEKKKKKDAGESRIFLRSRTGVPFLLDLLLSLNVFSEPVFSLSGGKVISPLRASLYS